MARVMPSSAAAASTERTTFLGVVVPAAVKKLPKLLSSLQPVTQLSVLQGQSSERYLTDTLDSLRSHSTVCTELLQGSATPSKDISQLAKETKVDEVHLNHQITPQLSH